FPTSFLLYRPAFRRAGLLSGSAGFGHPLVTETTAVAGLVHTTIAQVIDDDAVNGACLADHILLGHVGVSGVRCLTMGLLYQRDCVVSTPLYLARRTVLFFGRREGYSTFQAAQMAIISCQLPDFGVRLGFAAGDDAGVFDAVNLIPCRVLETNCHSVVFGAALLDCRCLLLLTQTKGDLHFFQGANEWLSVVPVQVGVEL